MYLPNLEITSSLPLLPAPNPRPMPQISKYRTESSALSGIHSLSSFPLNEEQKKPHAYVHVDGNKMRA